MPICPQRNAETWKSFIRVRVDVHAVILGDLERFPTPRTARSATGHGDNGRNGAIGGVSGNPSARCNVRKIRTFTLEMPCIIRFMLSWWRSFAVERRTGGILELPLLAPCGILN